jgi:hypothetical protein
MPPKWNGRKLVLELHHIDGNHFNNNLDNVQFLCPNCHAQIHVPVKARKPRTPRSKGIPREAQRKVDRPPLEEVRAIVDKHGYSAAGRKYGVSDNSVRKWLKNGIQ